MATTPCLIEPFRQPPTPTEVRNCLLKLFLIQADCQRKARRQEERLPEAELPQLWILRTFLKKKIPHARAKHLAINL